jgi:hypothetical protein
MAFWKVGIKLRRKGCVFVFFFLNILNYLCWMAFWKMGAKFKKRKGCILVFIFLYFFIFIKLLMLDEFFRCYSVKMLLSK